MLFKVISIVYLGTTHMSLGSQVTFEDWQKRIQDAINKNKQARLKIESLKQQALTLKQEIQSFKDKFEKPNLSVLYGNTKDTEQRINDYLDKVGIDFTDPDQKKNQYYASKQANLREIIKELGHLKTTKSPPKESLDILNQQKKESTQTSPLKKKLVLPLQKFEKPFNKKNLNQQQIDLNNTNNK